MLWPSTIIRWYWSGNLWLKKLDIFIWLLLIFWLLAMTSFLYLFSFSIGCVIASLSLSEGFEAVDRYLELYECRFIWIYLKECRSGLIEIEIEFWAGDNNHLKLIALSKVNSLLYLELPESIFNLKSYCSFDSGLRWSFYWAKLTWCNIINWLDAKEVYAE